MYRAYIEPDLPGDRYKRSGENSRQIEAEPCGNFRTITLE